MKRTVSALTALSLIAACLFVGPPGIRAEERAAFYNDAEGRIFACGNRGERCVALTFDDGPHPVYTDRILKVLRKYGVRATFFVIGENVSNYPEVFGRVVNEGHTIGSHTFSHAHVKNMRRADLFEEYRKTDRLLRAKGVVSRLFRPPEGVCDGKVRELAQVFDCDIILWSIDTRDWQSPPAREIVREVRGKVSGGEIVLMHDYVSGKSHTAEALETLLPELLSQGYEFLTVDELIARSAAAERDARD